MKKLILLSTLLLLTGIQTMKAQNPKDATRLAELDQYWAELTKTVQEGDFEGYKAGYHDDAVIIFASGKNKESMPIAKALAAWKPGFDATKAGKQSDDVEFRFSQRIGDETTAHETGIFIFTSNDQDGKTTARFVIHFEMLFVKREGKWYAVMEYQKSNATEEEWEALK